MQFGISYEIATDQRNAAEARFKETGALPPEGVTLLGRWHDVSKRCGYMVVESDDQLAVAAYLRQWTDLLTFDIAQVISDEQLAQIMG